MGSLVNFEHSLAKKLRERGVSGHLLLVATSGGADSIALLQSLVRIQHLLRNKVVAVHVHHGWINGPQGEFRNRAWKFVRDMCSKGDVEFYSNVVETHPKLIFTEEPEKTLKSESELRDFRYKVLNSYLVQLSAKHSLPGLICTAHNSNDLLETRLIRLIRGTGAGGIEGIRFQDGDLLRPLLDVDRTEIINYLKQQIVKYIDDPSNLSSDPFRNWIRNDWLPQLEEKRPGSIDSMARSLRLLMEENNTHSLRLEEFLEQDALDKSKYLALDQVQKKQLLARYLRHLGVRNYGLGHIEEILKRLDTSQKVHTFTVLKHDWQVNAEQIKARPS